MKAPYFHDSVGFEDVCMGNVTDPPIAFVCCLLLVVSFKRLWLGSRGRCSWVYLALVDALGVKRTPTLAG